MGRCNSRAVLPTSVAKTLRLSPGSSHSKHRRTATTAAYTHPNYAAGVAIQRARFGFRHTDSENAHGGETETAPSACDHLVGTGGFEPPTPTVSR